LIISNAYEATMTKPPQDYASLRIASVHAETDAALRVEFDVPKALRATFAFKPGQHLPVRGLINGVEQRRTYSICSAPGMPLTVAIKRVHGGLFSNWANSTFKSGIMLEAMPPIGRFTLRPSDGTPRHILMVAAGAGITPIFAMLAHALEAEPATRITLLFGNRTVDSIMFREALEDMKDRHLGRFELVHVLSRNDEMDAPLFQGRISGDKLHQLATSLLNVSSLDHAYLCGPGTLIKETRDALVSLGMPKEKIYHEFFAAGGGAHRATSVEKVPTAPVSENASGASEVVAILDGMRHRFALAPGAHVLDAAITAGLRVPYSCKGGMCCTCRAKVVEGKASMTVNYSLEPWEIEKGFILTCQARAETPRLVVDYDAM
jgi:ring-1,2-phenylacetyl-CoA epoxidase subunit PaaE